MTLVIKAIIIILLFFIFFSLGSALYYLIRGDRSEHIVKALTWRIALSILLFLFLLFSFAMGWITPHTIF